MKIKDQIKKSLHYSLNDWKVILLLGIIITLVSSIEEIELENDIFSIILWIILIVLLLIEEGYRAKIIETSVHGEEMPLNIFHDMKGLMKSGYSELVILIVYFIIYYGAYNILVNIPDLCPDISETNLWVIIGMIIVFLIIMMACFFIAPINKALNNDELSHAFNIVEIMKLYWKMGIFKAIFSITLAFLSINLVVAPILNWGILDASKLLDFLISFIFTPIILMFTTKFLCLSAKEAANA